MAQPNDVVISVGPTGFRTEITARGHTLIADEPIEVGGGNEGPTPYDYLAASLGACTAMTLRIYANRREWPLEGVRITMRHSRVHEKDCEDCASRPVGIDQLEREIELSGPLTEEQHAGLMRIADRCPVAQTLERGVRVVPARPVSPTELEASDGS